MRPWLLASMLVTCPATALARPAPPPLPLGEVVDGELGGMENTVEYRFNAPGPGG
ncbi:MAG: hypothetical protein ACYTG1_02425 [Planctomycetota bacterium]|jgi:hypothetical protein